MLLCIHSHDAEVLLSPSPEPEVFHSLTVVQAKCEQEEAKLKAVRKETSDYKQPMSEHEQRTDECVNAFKSGNKQVAEQLLPSIRPAVVRTTFKFWFFRSVAMVSLLHLAAYWGWKDIAVCLVTVHKCVANWRDKDGHIPLHYAAYNGHLEVVKYFITELLCDPMDRNICICYTTPVRDITHL